MSNSFITSAQRMKREQEKIETQKEEKEALSQISLMIPSRQLYLIQKHRLQTGENMTQLIRRLVKEELEERYGGNYSHGTSSIKKRTTTFV